MAKTRTLDQWDQRLMQGFVMPGVPEDTRALLVTALGALGCEAEYGVSLLRVPLHTPRPTRVEGEQWLRQILHLSQRLTRVSIEVEVAVQSYLGALALVDQRRDVATPTGTHLAADDWSTRFDATPGTWWPAAGAIMIEREPIEIWLRRAGFAYRHTVTMGLPDHIESLDQTLTFIMHALRTLPPGGVLTRDALAISLLTLSTEIEGDLVPHHLHDLDARHVGLMTGIAAMLRLTPPMGAKISADVAWSRGELRRVRATAVDHHERHGGTTRPLSESKGGNWAGQLVAEWESIIAVLEGLQAELESPNSATHPTLV